MVHINNYIAGHDPIEPGYKSGTFTIFFKEPYFRKNDVITAEENHKLKVIKVYKYNLWRKFLNLLSLIYLILK